MYNSRIKLKFKERRLKQEDTAAFIPKNVMGLFIVYELDTWSSDLNTNVTLKDCLFGAVKLTKNGDPDKNKYCGYGIGFNSRSYSSLPDGSMGRNVIIFGADMSSTVHIDNKGKDILILLDEATQGLDGNIFIAEAKYSINFIQSNRKFCLSLHYNRSNSFLFVNATKMYQYKGKDSEIKKYALCLVNI